MKYFIANTIDTYDPSGLVMMNQTAPKSWANLKCVVTSMRLDENVRIQYVHR